MAFEIFLWFIVTLLTFIDLVCSSLSHILGCWNNSKV